MAVLLNQAYAGYQAGTVVVLPADTEAALIAQGIATNSTATVTTGAVTTTLLRGRVAAAIGTSQIIVTCPQCTPQSIVFAQVAQAVADTTLTSVLRCTPGNGSFQINGSGAAAAVTQINWFCIP